MDSTVTYSVRLKRAITHFVMRHGRKVVIGLPYLWLTLLFLVPFLIVFKISFSDMVIGIPPYTNLSSWDEGKLAVSLSFNNYAYILEDSADLRAYGQTLKLVILAALAWCGVQQVRRIKQRRASASIMSIVLKFLLVTLLIFVGLRLVSWFNLSFAETVALLGLAAVMATVLFVLLPRLNRRGRYFFEQKSAWWLFIITVSLLFCLGKLTGLILAVDDGWLNTLLDSMFMRLHFIDSPIFAISASLDDSVYIDGYIQSVKIATISTLLCLVIAYPIAWAISQCRPSTARVLLLLIILPSWTSFLIRIYAWTTILRNNGLLNYFLLSIGIIDEPLIIMNTNLAIYIGIVYTYLPFAVLPIYNSITKIDPTLIEAAADLGCKPSKTFLNIILPLTKNGIIAGAMLVLIPSVGEYVIPELLGGSNSNMIGRLLWEEFFKNRDWPMASAVASVMLLILIVPITYFIKQQNQEARG